MFVLRQRFPITIIVLYLFILYVLKLYVREANNYYADLNVQLLKVNALFLFIFPASNAKPQFLPCSILFRASLRLMIISTSIFTASIGTLDHQIIFSKTRIHSTIRRRKINSSLRRAIKFDWKSTSKIGKLTIAQAQFAAMML